MAGTGFLLGRSARPRMGGNPWLALLVSIPVGLGGAGFVARMNAITQQQCPPEMRGRILGLTAVAFLGSYPIGGPITGIIGDEISVQWSLVTERSSPCSPPPGSSGGPWAGAGDITVRGPAHPARPIGGDGTEPR